MPHSTSWGVLPCGLVFHPEYVLLKCLEALQGMPAWTRSRGRLRALCTQLQRQAESGKLPKGHELLMSTTCTAATSFEGLLTSNQQP
jgi:hypothetical protein